MDDRFLKRRITQLRKCLRAICDFEPNEVAIDQFAYDRMVDNFREAASTGLSLDTRAAKKKNT